MAAPMDQPADVIETSPKGVDFPAFLGALFLSKIGDQVLLFLVPLVVFQTTRSTAWAGWAFAAEALPRFAAFPVCGALCDRVSAVRLMRWSQLLRAMMCLAGLAGDYVVGGVGWLIGLSALCGVLTTQGTMSREVILPQAFRRLHFERVLAYSQTADQVGAVLGPVLAAALLTLVPWQSIVVVAASLFFAADLLLACWRRNTTVSIEPRGKAGSSWLSPLRIAFAHIVRTPALRNLVIQAAGVNLVVGITLASCAAMFTGVLQRTAGEFAYLQTAGAVATVVILMGIAHAKLKIAYFGLAAYIALILGGILTASGIHPAVYVAGYLLVIGFDKMFNIYLRSTRQRVIPVDDFGKTTGLMTLLNNLTQPLAGVILGAAAPVLSPQVVILALSLTMAILGAMSLYGGKQEISAPVA
jgi:MFS family permease